MQIEKQHEQNNNSLKSNISLFPDLLFTDMSIQYFIEDKTAQLVSVKTQLYLSFHTI